MWLKAKPQQNVFWQITMLKNLVETSGGRNKEILPRRPEASGLLV